MMIFCLVIGCWKSVADAGVAAGGSERPRIAIIIDDLGYDIKLARRVFSLNMPLTMAIIPCAPCASSIDAEAHARGYETIAHIPMEPKNFPKTDPGPGTLMLYMDRGAIEETLSMNLMRVPGAGGASNHMGSAFTESYEKMEPVLEALKRNGMYFIDSLTSPDSICKETALGVGVRFAERDVFLDNEINTTAIEKQLRLLFLIAERRGLAIGIGHPYPETIEVLSGYREEILARFLVVPVSRVIETPPDVHGVGECTGTLRLNHVE